MDQQKETNLWSQVLDETRSQVQRKFKSTKTLLVLGDDFVGKTTLISHLRRGPTPIHGLYLEYTYIDFEDYYHDESRRLSVWVLGNDLRNSNILGHALNASNFQDTMVMLVLSMSEPWKWPQQMNSWLKMLSDYVEGLGLSSEVKEAAQQLLIKKFQYYLEEQTFGIPEKRKSLNQFLQCKEIEIGDMEKQANGPGIIEKNLGLDIVVVVTKVDQVVMLERLYDMNDIHFNFMQQWLRHYCLKIGAGLIYTSVKNEINCDVLQRYLAERFYFQPNDYKPQVIDRDFIFLPAGWDSLGKIAILNEQLTMLDRNCAYETLIPEPINKRAGFILEPFVENIDEQAFLARQLELDSDLLKPQPCKVGNNTSTATTKKCEDVIESTPPDTNASPLEQFFKDLLRRNNCARTCNNGEGDGVNVTTDKPTSSNVAEIFERLSMKEPNNNNESDEQPKE